MKTITISFFPFQTQRKFEKRALAKFESFILCKG